MPPVAPRMPRSSRPTSSPGHPTTGRFDCAAGNPPFIRYQRFTGATRRAALDYCRRLGVTFSGLSSSWAPFIVADRQQAVGRIAFVVPAEIGHASYAVPLLDYLVGNFGAPRGESEKVFPRLSEDCWLLFADNAGCRTIASGSRSSDSCRVRCRRRCRSRFPSRLGALVGRQVAAVPSAAERSPHLRAHGGRSVRSGWGRSRSSGMSAGPTTSFICAHPRWSDSGYPTSSWCRPSGTAGTLPASRSTTSTSSAGSRGTNRSLLRIPPRAAVPGPVQAYLDTAEGRQAKASCRNRTPWYTVPDVRRPEFVLTYMSGKSPALAINRRDARTNALLARPPIRCSTAARLRPESGSRRRGARRPGG